MKRPLTFYITGCFNSVCIAQAWTYTVNPTSAFDGIYGIVSYQNRVYVAGEQSPPQWRIEKHDSGNGALISSFGAGGVVISNPTANRDLPYAIAVNGNSIYVAGHDAIPGATNFQWRIERRDTSDGSLIAVFGTAGVVNSDPSTDMDIAYAITIDADTLYVVGSDSIPGNAQWRIEKRNRITGSLITGFGSGGVVTTNPTSATDIAYAVTADATGIYVAGVESYTSDGRWRIEKYNSVTGNVLWTYTVNPSGGNDIARSIAVDGSGVYVGGVDIGGSGQWRVQKHILSTGALITGFGTGGVVISNPTTAYDDLRAITVDGNAIYLGGFDTPSAGNQSWRTEVRDFTTGALFSTCTVTNDVSGGNDNARAITVDASGYYAAGGDFAPGNGEIRIQKHELCPESLPVELLFFRGECINHKTQIVWAASSQTNNDYFTIERSENGINFTSTGTVKGAGNSSQTIYYSFFDEDPLIGISYYRLKQTDFNGQYHYFHTIGVNCVLQENTITIYPSPTSENFSIELPENISGKIKIEIYNSLGQKVYSEEKETANQEIISVSDLNFRDGIYCLQISNGEKHFFNKLIIQK